MALHVAGSTGLMSICTAAKVWLAALMLLQQVTLAPAASTGLRRGLTDGIDAYSPLSVEDSVSKWILASFPPSRIIMYARLPDTTWRPLVTSGLVSPKAIAIDKQRARLYVVDSASAKIYWYQLRVPDGKTLMTDGIQHLAVQSIIVRTLTLSTHGDLYFTGSTIPPPPMTPVDGVFLVDTVTIANCEASGNYNIPPKELWTKSITGSVPDALSLDSFNMWWGNTLDGDQKGSVVKASLTVPMADPQQAMTIKANNVPTVYSLALTPTTVFYGSDNAIHVVQKNKIGQDCGSENLRCPVVSNTVEMPTAMVWDGDGTVFVADNKKGAIYSFPSGSRGGNALEKFVDSTDIWGMDVFEMSADAHSFGTRSATALFLVSAMPLCVSAVLLA